MNNKKNPFDAFNTFAPIFTNLVNDVLTHANIEQTETKGETYKTASANIIEVENGYELQVAFPGFTKEEITLDIDGDTLKITTQKSGEQSDSIKYLKKEIDTRNYRRVFSLSNKIDRTKIAAEYKNGVLYVSLPKKEDVSFKINVQ
jgi:HSP20 family protein